MSKSLAKFHPDVFERCEIFNRSRAEHRVSYHVPFVHKVGEFGLLGEKQYLKIRKNIKNK